MKSRTGYVSNSSSSSFLLAVNESAHNKAKRHIHPFLWAVVEAFTRKRKVLGQDCLVGSWVLGIDEDYDPLEYLDVEYYGTLPEGISKGNYRAALFRYVAQMQELNPDAIFVEHQ